MDDAIGRVRKKVADAGLEQDTLVCFISDNGGPTMVGPRATWVAHPFEDRTLGEDTTFQRDILAAGGGIYSADRFNFIQVRDARAGHTWHMDDERILANGVVHGFGRADDHVLL